MNVKEALEITASCKIHAGGLCSDADCLVANAYLQGRADLIEQVRPTIKALEEIKQRKCECYFEGYSTCCHWQDQEVAEKALTPDALSPWDKISGGEQ